MPPPIVIVRFYKNLRLEDKPVAGATVSAFGEEEVEPGVFVRFIDYEFRVIANGGSYDISVHNDGEIFPPPFTRTTTVAYNASAAAIASALDALGTLDGVRKWTFEGLSDTPHANPEDNSHLVRAYSADFSGNWLAAQIAFPGNSLTGNPTGVYEEDVFKLPLEEAPIGKPEVPASEIEPVTASSSPTPTPHRQSSQHLTGAAVQHGAGRDPFPDYTPGADEAK